jgi:hypothetical protein
VPELQAPQHQLVQELQAHLAESAAAGDQMRLDLPNKEANKTNNQTKQTNKQTNKPTQQTYQTNKQTNKQTNQTNKRPGAHLIAGIAGGSFMKRRWVSLLLCEVKVVCL